MTTFSAASNDIFIKMTKFQFQCSFEWIQCIKIVFNQIRIITFFFNIYLSKKFYISVIQLHEMMPCWNEMDIRMKCYSQCCSVIWCILRVVKCVPHSVHESVILSFCVPTYLTSDQERMFDNGLIIRSYRKSERSVPSDVYYSETI